MQWSVLNFFFSTALLCLGNVLYAVAGVNAPGPVSLGNLTLGDFDTHEVVVNLCIFSEKVSGTYKVKATSLHSLDNQYRMKHEFSNQYMLYTLSFADNEPGYKNLAYDTYLTEQTTGGQASACEEDNAKLKITLVGNEVSGVPAGGYEDIITLMIQEE
jgi:hypothetical protein